jgi:ATP-binding cassette subfamily A (ABC1) protein 3
MDRIRDANKLSEVSSEMTYQLPNDAVKNFKEFFETLDRRKSELGLKSYGIGVTTLEEVFLKV